MTRDFHSHCCFKNFNWSATVSVKMFSYFRANEKKGWNKVIILFNGHTAGCGSLKPLGKSRVYCDNITCDLVYCKLPLDICTDYISEQSRTITVGWIINRARCVVCDCKYTVAPLTVLTSAGPCLHSVDIHHSIAEVRPPPLPPPSCSFCPTNQQLLSLIFAIRKS